VVKPRFKAGDFIYDTTSKDGVVYNVVVAGPAAYVLQPYKGGQLIAFSFDVDTNYDLADNAKRKQKESPIIW